MPKKSLFQEPIEEATAQPSAQPAPSEAAEETTAAPEVTEPVTEPEVVMDEATRRMEEFRQRILDARKPEEKPHVPQPVAPRILEQTRLEMEMGAKMNAHHADLMAKRPPVVRTKREVMAEGSSTPVFRPHSYVPDPAKNQGHVQARTL